MPISQAQTNILELAYANNGYFDPSMTPLRGGALKKVITALQNKSLLTTKTKCGYPITNRGIEALGIQIQKPTPRNAREGSKTAMLIKMLQRKNGATNPQIQAALNWQPHSVRSMISGTLKKKMGYEVITDINNSGNFIYRIDI